MPDPIEAAVAEIRAKQTANLSDRELQILLAARTDEKMSALTAATEALTQSTQALTGNIEVLRGVCPVFFPSVAPVAVADERTRTQRVLKAAGPPITGAGVLSAVLLLFQYIRDILQAM